MELGRSRVSKSFALATGGFEEPSEVLYDWTLAFLGLWRVTGGFSSPSRQLGSRSE